jgi:hypothetical protein
MKDQEEIRLKTDYYAASSCGYNVSNSLQTHDMIAHYKLEPNHSFKKNIELLIALLLDGETVVIIKSKVKPY